MADDPVAVSFLVQMRPSHTVVELGRGKWLIGRADCDGNRCLLMEPAPQDQTLSVGEVFLRQLPSNTLAPGSIVVSFENDASIAVLQKVLAEVAEGSPKGVAP